MVSQDNGMALTAVIVFIATCQFVTSNPSYSPKNSADEEEDAIKEITIRCTQTYTMTCFKLDLLSLINRLDGKGRFQLVSGISLIHEPKGDKVSTGFPRELVTNMARENFTDDTVLDLHLFSKMGNFLRSIQVSFPLVSERILDKMNNFFGITEFTNSLSDANTGRRRVKTRWIRWAASIGYAVAFGLLAGLVSKSLMLSLVALAISFIARIGNGFGFGFGNPAATRNNYEIVAHPLPQIQHLNTHSTEVKYEEDANSSGSQGVAFVYPRNIPGIEKVLAFHHLANLHNSLSEDNAGDVLAYKGYITKTQTK